MSNYNGNVYREGEMRKHGKNIGRKKLSYSVQGDKKQYVKQEKAVGYTSYGEKSLTIYKDVGEYVH